MNYLIEVDKKLRAKGCIKIDISEAKSYYKFYDFDLDRESILPFDYCDIKHYCSNEIDIFMLTEGYVEESECIGIYYVPLKTIGLANIEGRNIDQFSAILLFLKSKNEDTIDDVWECTPSSDTKLAIINFLRNLNLR